MKAKRANTVEQVVDGFVLKFDYLKIEIRVCDFRNYGIERTRPSSTTNLGCGDGSFIVVEKKSASGSFSEKFKSRHFIGAKNTRFAVDRELFQKLPAESSFPSGGSCADDVKTRTKKLILVNVEEPCFAIGVNFEVVNFDFEMIGKEMRNI